MANRTQIPSLSAEQRYVDAAELLVIFPVTGMTIHRWVNDPRVNFPKPVKLANDGRNFWWLPELREWQRQRAALTTKRRVPQGARSGDRLLAKGLPGLGGFVTEKE